MDLYISIVLGFIFGTSLGALYVRSRHKAHPAYVKDRVLLLTVLVGNDHQYIIATRNPNEFTKPEPMPHGLGFVEGLEYSNGLVYVEQWSAFVKPINA